MTTITVPAPAEASSRRSCPDIPAKQRIAIRHIPWDLYDRLSDAIAEGQNIHLAYDGNDLEVMVVGREREDFKDLFSRAQADTATERRGMKAFPEFEPSWPDGR